MSRFLILAVALCVGCAKPATTPPTVASAPAVPVAVVAPVAPVADGFTPDTDLVAFKDNPKAFAGKTFKVRAEYFNQWWDRAPDVNLPLRKDNAPFRKTCKVNGSDVVVTFFVGYKGMDVPNGSVGETFVIEFEYKELNRFKGDIIYGCVGKSITR